MGHTPSEAAPEADGTSHAWDSPPHTRAWSDGKVIKEGFPVSEVSDYLERGDTVVWLDLCSPNSTGLNVISEELGLDHLAVEDAVSAHERTKIDRYRSYVFLNLYAPEVTADGTMVLHELSAFVTEHALVTVRQDAGLDVGRLIERWDDAPDITLGDPGGVTPAVLLYGLLDLVVDLQLDVTQTLDDEADALEELIFETSFPVREIQQRSFRLRKNLVALRRVGLPMREVVNTILRRDLRFVAPVLSPYYQDVYDHTLRVAEWTDGLRDLVANLLDTRIALQGNRMNEVMKKVTSWAAIIAVPTAVTGFYGQNVPYPGFNTHWGFVISTVVIIILSVSLYIVFKLRDWL
ncbi:magnesium transporter CorA family protein [Actinomadura barringtoniae]|uniref:Magnesium transporter CorA family protein n=1 Tax=Actinomadura barringtoniae TaxID=1427535 RepID=A0A939P858_9ACTN|nr:magnesium transporter CorA family protein [Actinomadura barringtoniae]MBO2447047.1 magnesium transporter CorA family protein [Actinomadura barringtoniae]